MDKKTFSKNKGVSVALLAMAMALQPTNNERINTDKKGYVKDYRKKTKKGAKHVVGVSFKPRKVFKVTGAQYRNEHWGNREKAFRKQLKMEKRKWISA